jgi:hypothetical protein
MSPRLFTTPRDDVPTGGDRPLRSLFLVITDCHTGEIGDCQLDAAPASRGTAFASGTTGSISRPKYSSP